jgi:uncharacterized protein YggE
MATVTAHGEATVRAQPDAAMLWLVVTALEPEAPVALADVTSRAGVLAALLDELGLPAGDRTTTGVTVREEFEYSGRGRRSLGHRATTTLSVRLEDPEPAGRLIGEATGRAGARVSGPVWLVDDDNPAHLEAARRAAADAHRRAQAYADGVGARLGAIERIEEPREALAPHGWRAAAALSARGGDGDELPVEAGMHDITASVLVTFALETD